jgi:hypothetical protein
MAKAGQRKCMSCAEFFIPDHRKGERQRYCCAADCRRASKAASQAAWLAQPSNNDYFSGPLHVARVQAWRAAHPGYSRGRARPSRALQDLLTPQVPDAIEECANRVEASLAGAAVALQDLLNTESPLLAGLVAHLFQRALQDDMASTIRRLVQLGEDVIKRGRGEDSQAGFDQASAATAADAPGALAVQLD